MLLFFMFLQPWKSLSKVSVMQTIGGFVIIIIIIHYIFTKGEDAAPYIYAIQSVILFLTVCSLSFVSYTQYIW